MAAVVAFVDDLMFLSRIREAASRQQVEVQSARKVPQLLEAVGAGARLVILDLDSPRLDTAGALLALRTEHSALPVIGFFSHVDVDKARVAQAAGCQRVLPRSAFVQKLDALLAEVKGAGAGDAEPEAGT
jgi:DNA-binding NtrC family response regulator